MTLGSRRSAFRRLTLETLEGRRVMTASPLNLASSIDDLIAAHVGPMAPDADHDDDHHDDDHHDDDHHDDHPPGAVQVEAGSGDTAGAWDTGTPAPITQAVTVQPIVVSNDDGSNTAEYFGNTTQQAIIHDLIDQIWAQAGIDIEWLSPNYWNNTFANIGNGSSRPTSDLGTVTSSGDSAGVGHSDPLVLDLYFVEISAGFSNLGENYANGLAYVDGNGSTIHVGDNLVSFSGGREVIARVVAHEIGHNLGLNHVATTNNLMADGELLSSSQVTTSLASDFSVELPEDVRLLTPGGSAISPNGQYRLTLQTDGNLVLSEVGTGTSIWQTRTEGIPVNLAVMQADGNFVLYNGSTPVWLSNTGGNPGASLFVDNSGELRIVSTNSEVLWKSLAVVDVLAPGQSVTSANGLYQLLFQADGNLVLYDLSDGTPIWQSRTHGTGASLAVMQADGNFVLYSGSTPVWLSNTGGNSGATMVVDNAGLLKITSPNEEVLWRSLTKIDVLAAGQSVSSWNGLYQLLFQTDGNLVLYDLSSGRAIWQSQTNGTGANLAVMQADGNFVLYNGGTPVWLSNTPGNTDASLVLDNSGVLKVISSNDEIHWSSQTAVPLLTLGGSVTSLDGRYQFTLQTDGNLVLWDHQSGHPVWQSQTQGTGATFALMQTDGNFVLYRGSTPVWLSNTSGNSGALMILDHHGLRVVSKFGEVLWQAV